MNLQGGHKCVAHISLRWSGVPKPQIEGRVDSWVLRPSGNKPDRFPVMETKSTLGSTRALIAEVGAGPHSTSSQFLQDVISLLQRIMTAK